MGKKSEILKQALLEAEELELASMENAKNIIFETFNPDMVEFFKSAIYEAEEVDDEDMEDDDDVEDDEEEIEEAKHDNGKEPDPGREGTDPAIDDDEENKPIDIAESDDEDEDDFGGDSDPDEDEDGDEPIEEGDDEDSDDDEELDVPDEVFDDEDDVANDDSSGSDPGDGDEDVDDDDDVEVKISMDDDDDEDVDEDIDIDVEDDDEDGEEDSYGGEDFEDDSEDDGEQEEFEEGLYIHKGGKFQKTTPAEYMQTRVSELEEENEKYQKALGALNGQLKETNLFNAKLAHLNKLYMSGAFTNDEKLSIAERLDECDEINEVKAVYKKVIKEVENKNPLEDFSNVIKEVRNKNNGTPKEKDNVYKSEELARMLKIATYDECK